MHEILFRGKRKDNGEWVRGFPFAYQARLVVEGIETWDGNRYRIDPSTVGQYTGLLDKNGKRIFEGDVVDAVRSGDETWRCVVSDIRKIPAEMCGSNVKSMDIVGNIHDNPELLEEVSVNA